MKIFFRAVIVIITCLFMPIGAWAHAYLDHADPQVGATVSQPPVEVKIWFTEEIDPSGSTMEVLDATGKQVDKKDVHMDANDDTLLIVSLPELAAGTYQVVWHAVCVNNHKTQGSFKFTVKSKE